MTCQTIQATAGRRWIAGRGMNAEQEKVHREEKGPTTPH